MNLSIRKPVAFLAAFAALAGSTMIAPPAAHADLTTTCYYETTTITTREAGIIVEQTSHTRLLYCITVPS